MILAGADFGRGQGTGGHAIGRRRIERMSTTRAPGSVMTRPRTSESRHARTPGETIALSVPYRPAAARHPGQEVVRASECDRAHIIERGEATMRPLGPISLYRV
jgi:hypothetical protein